MAEREAQNYAMSRLQGTTDEKMSALGLINLAITAGYRPEDLRELLVTNRTRAHDMLLKGSGFDPERLAEVVNDVLDYIGADDMKHECPSCCPELFNEDGSRKDGNV